MGLSQIVNVVISRQTQAVSQAGFGTPLILGANAGFSGVHSYTALKDVLADFSTSNDEYKAAAKIFGQSPHPVTVKIGKALSKVAQVDTITPTAVNTTHYIVSITPDHAALQSFDYTSDGSATVSEIVAGLAALINASGTYPAGVTASGSTTLIMTANTSGQPFTTSINASPNMTLAHTTANVGVVESLAALSLNYDDDWYGLVSTFRSNADILQIAAYMEGQSKIFGVSSNASAMYDSSSTTDLAYLLKAASYFRTFLMYSADTANFPEAAMFGRVLPLVPGSETWAFKTLAGVVVDALSGTQINALKGKNCGYYIPLGGVNITLDGLVAGGDYIDVIRLIDLITARMMEGIFGALTRADKIPFTNGGISVIESLVAGVLKANQKTGGISPDQVDTLGNVIPGFSTDFPNITEISTNDRAARTLNGGTWTARIAGAIQAITINGTVTV